MRTFQDTTIIKQLIFKYRDAFNAADTSAIVTLYAPNGVLMPNNAPSATGAAELTKSFDSLLKNFQISIEYFIDEINGTEDYAFARTNSKVNTLITANGERIFLVNKELFVFIKLNSEWKIAQYIFNNTSTKKDAPII